MINELTLMSSQTIQDLLTPFIKYLSKSRTDGIEALPSLIEISKELHISVSKLREELGVAKAFGLIDIKPRLGIKNLPYSFSPAVTKSLAFAISTAPESFKQFSDLRNHIETAYWYQAVSALKEEDILKLKQIVRVAEEKLNKYPITIPHFEHRQLHLTIYSRLENPFALGILESFWDIYEAIGLNIYEDRSYLKQVWNYHHQMVDAIVQQEFTSGYQALITHMDLLFQRSQKSSMLLFE